MTGYYRFRIALAAGVLCVLLGFGVLLMPAAPGQAGHGGPILT
jgi:hypothetical protein